MVHLCLLTKPFFSFQGEGVIVLRDVTEGPTAFANVEHYRGLTISQAMCTVEHLAAIHAAATALLIEGNTCNR